MSDSESAVEVFIWRNESRGPEMMYHGPYHSQGAFVVKRSAAPGSSKELTLNDLMPFPLLFQQNLLVFKAGNQN